MGKRLNSKHKIDRRLGVNLWGRAKSPLMKIVTMLLASMVSAAASHQISVFSSWRSRS